VQFALGAASVGIVHADLDPENVLVLPDGQLAILDFGAWCNVDRERVALSAGALDSFLAKDVEAFAGALERLGWLPASHGGPALDFIAQVLDRLAGPGQTRLDGDALLAARDRLFEHPRETAHLILSVALPPQDLWPARSVGQLYGTIARLGASGDWPRLARTALGGWSKTVC
jgi:hypothetical protein